MIEGKTYNPLDSKLICFLLFQLQEFIEGKVLPQFADVINAATDLRNSISKEARQFGSVSLVSLDRRVVDG